MIQSEGAEKMTKQENGGPMLKEAASVPSAYAQSRVGRTMLYGVERREVVVEDVRRSAATIEDLDTGARWPGIQFKMRPADGGRAFWSTTFADRRPDE